MEVLSASRHYRMVMENVFIFVIFFCLFDSKSNSDLAQEEVVLKQQLIINNSST